MSIVVCCNLPDGVIMGADSYVTVSGINVDESGAQRPQFLKFFDSAQKIFELGTMPGLASGVPEEARCGRRQPAGGAAVAVGALGMYQLGDRTIGSHLEELDAKEGTELLHRGSGDTGAKGSLKPVCTGIWEFFSKRYTVALSRHFEQAGRKLDDVPPGDRPPLGFVIAGYAAGEVLGEVWLLDVRTPPEQGGIVQVREKGAFGATWAGVAGPISRFIKGYDNEMLPDKLRQLLNERLGEKGEEIWSDVEKLLTRMEYRIPYAAMPLEEGIEHVRYLVGLAISFAKYAVGPPLCGGEVRLAAITRRRGFRWIGREPM
jgi:hypothetical protein